jgi:8-oxo-dGTP pyrophosphatase MutT (NUDIX family)
MTDLRVGVVDVYVIRPYRDEWLVLALQRATTTRCPGSWETVHGRMEPAERPEEAAVREVREETGLSVDRLYSITCQPFTSTLLAWCRWPWCSPRSSVSREP